VVEATVVAQNVVRELSVPVIKAKVVELCRESSVPTIRVATQAVETTQAHVLCRIPAPRSLRRR